MTLQPGIGWSSSREAGPFFGLVCLRRTALDRDAAAAAALTDLWNRYHTLRRGELPDLPGAHVPPGGLTVLAGYGARAFASRDDETLVRELRECAFAAPTGDRGVLPGVALRYAADVADNPADADVVVQFTAGSQTAVTRAVAETRHRLADPRAPGSGALGLSGAYLGYRRDDRRSWIGFHDGVDNIDTRERANAIQIGGTADDVWLRGGTYLVFLRIVIDVEAWNQVPRDRQELLVGRDKRSGAPLAVTSEGAVAPVALAPGTPDVMARANLSVREPPPVGLDDASGLGASHIQRTRRSGGLRLFRQGYEFLETLDGPPSLRTGLNFVSFQASPLPVVTMLRTGSWLGGAGFGGGPAVPAPDDLLTVRAAGLFAVPPAASTGVPGLADVWPAG